MDILCKIENLINNKDIESAYKLIIENEEIYINNNNYWNLRGILCLSIQEYKSAISCFNKSIEMYGQDANVHYNLAYAYEATNNKSDAALYYGLACKYTEDEELKLELDKMYENSKLIDIYKVASSSNKKTFIVLSSCGWGDIYQRMHHISRSLAKFGNNVKYVSPASSININEPNASVADILNYSLNNKKIIDSVEIYQPVVTNYEGKNICNNYNNLVQELLDKASYNEEVVIITYMPYQVEVIKSLKGKFYHIYECVDDHSDIEHAFWTSKSDALNEQYLMNSADAITTTATSLFLQRRYIESRDNVYLSRNAVNEIDFIDNENMDIPEDIVNIPKPRIVYSGAVYDWFDIDLFYEIVKSNPDKSFVIIGFGKMDIFTDKPKNLYILGAKKHSQLKKYLKHMQVGIIPFKDNTDIIINCDPIKHYEYLSCKLPVVTTLMPECADKIYTLIANDVSSFNEAIDKCLNQKIDFHDVIEFISQNSWNKRAALLCRISDKENMTLEVTNITKKLESTLKELDTVYENSIFSALNTICIGLMNEPYLIRKYEKIYSLNNQKYIERIYLTALLKNNRRRKFKEVVLNSNFINQELKDTLKYIDNYNNKQDIFNIVAHICISNFIEAIESINNLRCKNEKNLYSIYTKFILGLHNNEDAYIFNNLSYTNIDLPIYKFLDNEINNLIRFKNKVEDEFVNIHWFNTMWCNYKCSYCHMEHDRKHGHAFDTATPREWANRFNSIKVPYTLYITGGEALLDINNFTEFYNYIIDSKFLKRVRIDTNCSMPSEKLKSLNLNKSKTILMASYHPSHINFEKYINNINEYRALGFEVSMVNMVCHTDTVDEYIRIKDNFKNENLNLNPGIYFDKQPTLKEDRSIKEYMSVLDKLDVGFKCEIFPTRGLKCKSSMHLLKLDYNGVASDCFGKKFNFLQENTCLDDKPKECIHNTCNCIEFYSLLDVCNRNYKDTLGDFIEKNHSLKTTQTKIVSIIGYFGDQNIGDELLLSSLIKNISDIPNIMPIVLCYGDSEIVSKTHNVIAVNLFDKERVSKVILMSDLVILGPGGLIEDYAQLAPSKYFSGEGVYSYLYPITLAHLYGKKSIAVGLGVGPVTMDETKNAICMTMKSMEKIFVRDRESYKFLELLKFKNIELCSDIGFNYNYDIYNSSNLKSNTIGICIRPFASINYYELANELKKICDYCINYLGKDICFIPMQFDYDFNILKSIVDYIKYNVSVNKERISLIERRLSIDEFIDLVSSLDLVIGMRLHSLIISLSCTTPVIALSYDPKVENIIKDLGFEDICFDVNCFKSEEIIKKVDYILTNKNYIVDKVEQTISDIRMSNVNVINYINECLIDI